MPAGAGASSPRPEAAPDEQGEPKSGDGPHVVRVGMLINDVQQLDLQTKSYAVDLYIWFKWDDPQHRSLAVSFEFLNPYQLWGHIRRYAGIRPETLAGRDPVLLPPRPGPVQRQPRDQRLPLRQPGVDSHDRGQVEGRVGARLRARQPDPIAVSPDISIPGWDIGDRVLGGGLEPVPDRPSAMPGVTADIYSRVIVALEVTRPASTYSLKLLLPMLLVALTAALALSVHPQYVEGRIGIGITALLTMVALQLTSDAGLPDVNNLILLDKLYVLSYVFVVLTLAVVVRNSWVDATGDLVAATRADRRGLVLLTAGYFGSAALILVVNLA